MAFDDKQKHQQLRPHAQFAVGSDIEVTSDEEGFRGIWFPAKILSPPSKARKNKYLVEYKTLVSEENGSDPLTELADPSFLRPALTTEEGDEGSFEVNDVVEAYHLDGWWIGVVVAVLGERSYRVFFNNPPDEVEFERSSLRLHKDWVDGKWIRPEKQTTGELMLNPGAAVEVNLNAHGSPDIWYPGTVVKDIGKRYFMVEYTSSNDTEVLKAVVDCLHIRPSPPTCNNNTFQLLDKVDAFINFGWLSGIITKVLDDGKYKVFFKQTKEQKELSHTDVRVPIMQINGKWFHSIQDIALISNTQEDLDPNLNDIGKISFPPENCGGMNGSAEDLSNGQEETAVLSERPYVDKRTTPLRIEQATVNKSTYEKLDEKSLPDVQSPQVSETKDTVPEDLNGHLPASLEIPAPDTDWEDNVSIGKSFSSGRKMVCFMILSNLCSIITQLHYYNSAIEDCSWASLIRESCNALFHSSTNKRASSMRRRGKKHRRTVWSEIRTPRTSAAGKGTLEKKNATGHVVNDIDGIRVNIANESEHEKEDLTDEVTTPKTKRGTLHDSLTADGKSNVDNTKEPLQITDGNETLRKSRRQRKRKSKYEMAVLALKPAKKKLRMTTETLSSTQESEDSPKCKAESEPVSNGDAGDIYDDKPLSSRLSDSHSPPVVDTIPENAAKTLPFPKNSPIWKIVEAMEVFQQIPQNPHFQPLYEAKEDCREGLAIGCMVTFSGLVEKISKFRFGDPKNFLDDSLETLSDLERHGLNVHPVRARLKELISIKCGHARSQNTCKDVKSQIEERKGQKAIIDEEINEIDKMIAELRTKRELALSRVEVHECEIEQLESTMESVKGGLEASLAEFERLATAQW